MSISCLKILLFFFFFNFFCEWYIHPTSPLHNHGRRKRLFLSRICGEGRFHLVRIDLCEILIKSSL
ncbi:hypothetical protein ACJW30_03G195200 [Castanea mollissima]